MKTKILTLTIISAILILAFATLASAQIIESVYVYKGTISSTGAEIKTPNKISDASAVIYACENQACSLATKLNQANPITQGNKIIINYPTNQKSEYGYLIYVYKQDTIPYAYKITKAQGYGKAPDRNVYLYQEYMGKAQIEDFDISASSIKTGETITITANILSPMVNFNNWYIPSEVKVIMNEKVRINAVAVTKGTESIVTSRQKEFNMPWSTEQEVSFDLIFKNQGDYTIKLFTEVLDNKFINTEKVEKTADIQVTKEITPDTDKDAPVITIISPENGKTYNQIIKNLHFEVYDESSVSCQYSTDNGITKTNVDCDARVIVLSSEQGTNTWTIYATDIYDNSAQESVTFKIDLYNGDVDNNGRKDTNTQGYKKLYDKDDLNQIQYYNQFDSSTERYYIAEQKAVIKEKVTFENYYLIILLILLVLIVLLVFLIVRIRR